MFDSWVILSRSNRGSEEYFNVASVYKSSVCLFACGGSLTSGHLFRAISRLPQGSAFHL